MSGSLFELTNSAIRKIQPYVAGKPIDELQRELGLSNIIKLASNENPLGPSPKAIAAIQDQLHNCALYPDSNGYHLKKALCDKLSIDMDMITLGNGSNDNLVLIAHAFLSEHHHAIYSKLGFIVYSLAAKEMNAQRTEVATNDFHDDLQGFLKAMKPNTRLIYLANPNNPTGTWHKKETIYAFLKEIPQNIIVVIDEAYHEYMVDVPGYESATQFLAEFNNLIITRTFSKAYGLAGLRIGYSIAHPTITDILNRIRQPFNVNLLGLIAAEAALTDEEFLKQTIATNKTGLQQLQHGLKELQLSFIPSYCNFLLVDFKHPIDDINNKLLQSGIIVRPVKNYGLSNHLRITVGLTEENNKLLAALAP